MEKIILWIWQLPQNILGYLLIKITKAHAVKVGKETLYLTSLFNSGICLGDYIIIDEYTYDWISEFSLLDKLNHELGHQKQSRILGWLYLFIVGIPSITRNIYARLKNKNSDWYYSGYPENWADKLGGVKR